MPPPEVQVNSSIDADTLAMLKRWQGKTHTSQDTITLAPVRGLSAVRDQLKVRNLDVDDLDLTAARQIPIATPANTKSLLLITSIGPLQLAGGGPEFRGPEKPGA